MNNKIVEDFRKMVDINRPIIYIHNFDFARIDDIVKQAIDKASVIEWNPATGTTNFDTRLEKGFGKDQPLVDFLHNEYTQEIEDGKPVNQKFIVLREIQDLIDDPAVKTLLAFMSQRKLYDYKYEKTIVIISSVNKVPEELKQYISYLDIPLPDNNEINNLIDNHIYLNDFNQFQDQDRQKLMPSLLGMTSYEIDRMLDVAMSSNGTLSAQDKEMILRQKKQMVRQSGILELIDTPTSIDEVGGLNALKEYIKRKSIVFANLGDAKAHGVSVPKGVFLVGMPGSGKSLCAKACASLFEAPLLKMDMGSMMGKSVGESEWRLRNAIKIAEASAPCILWIDEIEKAFSGVGGNNDILTRMFGYFLTWMQDKETAVYVIATANNAESLPPELKRKGRFDEIFCVNLPTLEERAKIFEVHLKKKEKQATKLSLNMTENDYEKLAKQTKGFSGADIEAVVNDTFERCFIEKTMVGLEELISTAKETISISTSCNKQIKLMQEIFNTSSFKDATTGKISNSSESNNKYNIPFAPQIANI